VEASIDETGSCVCEFCAQHGDGKRWYLEASNYAVDLSADAERRGYMTEFVQRFDERMPRNVELLETLQRLPGPLRRMLSTIVRQRQKHDHFGQPVPIEECERILEMTTSVVQLPCVCRHFSGTPERGYCLAVTVNPADELLAEAFRDYLDGPDTSGLQRLTKAEALDVLRRCEAEGLMHSVWTFKTPFIAAICNCSVEAGCMAMRTTVTYDVPIMWRGEYVAVLDATACSGCGLCLERCPFGALLRSERGVELDAGACWGCGVCRSACHRDALSLVERTSVPAVASVW